MKLREFLLDMVLDDGYRVSSSRVIMVMTFVVTSVIMLWLTYDGKMGVEYYLAYLGFGSGTFSWTKYVENKHASVAKLDPLDPSLRAPKDS